MGNRIVVFILAVFVTLIFTPRCNAQAGTAAKSGTSAEQTLNPRDLSGNWAGDNRDASDQKIPEPPLTEWAKQHLLYKSISHDVYSGTPIPGWDRPGHHCPNNNDPCYSKDIYGVPANDNDGEYPAKDCEPLSTPATYDYPGIGTMELIPTPDGTRFHQMISYHREWRTFWLNRQHPADLDPTYEGDSIAHWEGNTLVVDTIGYNDRTMVTQHVGHRKSDAFHLVERFTRIDKDHLRLEMTYYDPKAWGDKSWPGWYRNYRRVPEENFDEFICSPREYREYDSKVTNRILGPTAK